MLHKISVLLDEERVPEFYEMFGRWVGGTTTDIAPAAKEQLPWGSTDEDLALAGVVWGKLSDRAKAFFGYLMDNPGTPFSADLLATELEIPNGKYGVAGVLAWPGRHCLAVGRKMPIEYAEAGPGESATYWMTTEVAALFRRARDGDAI